MLDGGICTAGHGGAKTDLASGARTKSFADFTVISVEACQSPNILRRHGPMVRKKAAFSALCLAGTV